MLSLYYREGLSLAVTRLVELGYTKLMLGGPVEQAKTKGKVQLLKDKPYLPFASDQSRIQYRKVTYLIGLNEHPRMAI